MKKNDIYNINCNKKNDKLYHISARKPFTTDSINK